MNALRFWLTSVSISCSHRHFIIQSIRSGWATRCRRIFLRFTLYSFKAIGFLPFLNTSQHSFYRGSQWLFHCLRNVYSLWLGFHHSYTITTNKPGCLLDYDNLTKRHHYYTQVKPPSASTVLPTIKLDSSLAMNKITRAISSGWAKRPMGNN